MDWCVSTWGLSALNNIGGFTAITGIAAVTAVATAIVTAVLTTLVTLSLTSLFVFLGYWLFLWFTGRTMVCPCSSRSVDPSSPLLQGGYRATRRNMKYLKRYEAGKSIGYTMRASLKAKGLIPRSNGVRRVSEKYKTKKDVLRNNNKRGRSGGSRRSRRSRRQQGGHGDCWNH